MTWTEVTDVETVGNPTVVFIGRTRHYINRGDELTFRGDSYLLDSGRKYSYVGQTSEEPNDLVFFEDNNGFRKSLYRQDFRSYLLDGCFEIHDA